MSDEMLSLRCLRVLRGQGHPMAGSQVAGFLHEKTQPVIHMLSRLCTLKIVTKLQDKVNDHFLYQLGPRVVPDYDLGLLINGRSYDRLYDRKIVHGWMTHQDMLRALPAPIHPLDQAWKALHDCLGTVPRSAAPALPDPARPDPRPAPHR